MATGHGRQRPYATAATISIGVDIKRPRAKRNDLFGRSACWLFASISSLLLVLNFYVTDMLLHQEGQEGSRSKTLSSVVIEEQNSSAAMTAIEETAVEPEDAELEDEMRDAESTDAEGAAEEAPKPKKAPVGEAKSDAFDVTFVSQTSEDRVWMIEHIAKRWGGPLSIAVFVTSEGAFKPHRKRLTRISRQAGSHVEEIHGQPSDGFPINLLRNVAISYVRTSHFLLSDIDLWPSLASYNEILIQKAQYLGDPYTAFVLPAFEYAQPIPRKDLDAKKVREQVANALPTTFNELRDCYHSKSAQQCRIFKSSTDTHLTTGYEKWWRAKFPAAIPCFHSLRYEPYLVVPRLPTTPKFDERFLGYGKNKIQWIQHLRLIGFSFYVMPNAFLVHCPHPPSASRQHWNAYKSKKDRLFRDFIRARLKNATIDTPMCKHVNWKIAHDR